MLAALSRHRVRYLIIGGLAFIYHAKPRYTKDLDLWVDPAGDNIERANAALEEFGSPYTLSGTNSDEILQLGVPPNRIDLLVSTGEFSFADAWARREEAPYGEAPACWIDLDTLIEIKSARSIIRDTKRTSACSKPSASAGMAKTRRSLTPNRLLRSAPFPRQAQSRADA